MNEKKTILGEISDFVDRGYRNFLMRDLVSIVMPGFLFILTMLYINMGGDQIISLNYWEIVLLLFLSYPIGWAIFYLGLVIGIINLCPRSKEKWSILRSFRRIFPWWNNDDWNTDLRNYWKKELWFFQAIDILEGDKDIRKSSKIVKGDKELLYRERIITVRQMLGISSVSLIICSILLIGRDFKWWIGIIISLALLIAHHRLMEQIDVWQESRIERAKIINKEFEDLVGK